MEKFITKASEIIKGRTASGEYKNQYCVLAQEDLDGHLTAAVITPSTSDGIRQLTFCSGIGSNWAKRAERDNRAAVCFSSEEYSITLRGKLEILTDAATKQENWYSGLENHFSGADDPNYCVLRFTTEKYKLFVDWEETEGHLFCQSCGMPMTDDGHFGTEKDGSKSGDYCVYCYKNGGSTMFCTTEEFWGSDVFETAANIDSEEAVYKIREHILRLNPSAAEKKMLKFITG